MQVGRFVFDSTAQKIINRNGHCLVSLSGICDQPSMRNRGEQSPVASRLPGMQLASRLETGSLRFERGKADSSSDAGRILLGMTTSGGCCFGDSGRRRLGSRKKQGNK